MYSTWETLGAQVLAALFVAGSCLAAEQIKGERPQRRGQAGAVRADAPPPPPAAAKAS